MQATNVLVVMLWRLLSFGVPPTVAIYDAFAVTESGDRFNYRATDVGNRNFGPSNWSQVQCDNVLTCPGWPTNWELYNTFIPYSGQANTCIHCPDNATDRTDGAGALARDCRRRQQSPVPLHPGVTLERPCSDRHRMFYAAGECDIAELEFVVLPHVLRAWQPPPGPGCVGYPAYAHNDTNSQGGAGPDDDEGVTFDEPRQPQIDFSMGFPNPWNLAFTDISVPSQHTLEGVRYAAEVVLSHTYSRNEMDRLIGNVAILLEKGNETDEYGFLDLYIASWKAASYNTRVACGLEVRQLSQKDGRLDAGTQSTPPGTQRAMAARQGGWVNPYEFYLSTETEYYYRYEGSTLEPPCLEAVHWRVLKNTIKVSPRQINELEELLAQRLDPETCLPDTAGKPRNNGTDIVVDVNRPLQARNWYHKTVFCECADWSSRLERDKEYCQLSMEDRGVGVSPTRAPSSAPSMRPSHIASAFPTVALIIEIPTIAPNKNVRPGGNVVPGTDHDNPPTTRNNASRRRIIVGVVMLAGVVMGIAAGVAARNKLMKRRGSF